MLRNKEYLIVFIQTQKLEISMHVNYTLISTVIYQCLICTLNLQYFIIVNKKILIFFKYRYCIEILSSLRHVT